MKLHKKLNKEMIRMKKNVLKKSTVGAALTSIIVAGGFLSASAEDTPNQSELITEDFGIAESYVSDDPNEISTLATSGNMDGGYWIRGKRNGDVISEYKHYKKEGRASVTNGRGYHDDGGWKAKEKWSRASKDWTFRGINKAYYDN